MEPTLSPLGPWRGRDSVSPEGTPRDRWKRRSCSHPGGVERTATQRPRAAAENGGGVFRP